jgi:crotonobetainyl-CoA hydratase
VVKRYGHALVATINRPSASNAVNREVAALLGASLDKADRDSDIRAFVVTGVGDRAFSAGADLKAVAHKEPLIDPELAHWGFAGYVRHPIAKPTIAAVNGLALGGGAEIVLASDLAVAAESATIGLPEVSRGLTAAAGGVLRLPTQIPRKIALELMLTGDLVNAATAARWGLINHVAPDDSVLDAALELAERISRNAPLAVQASKRIAALSEEELWRRNDTEAALLKRSRDAQEGPLAYTEKRPPVWQGH